MKSAPKSHLIRTPGIAAQILIGLTLAAAMATTAIAQGELGSGTVAGYGSGPTYNYSLTFGDGAAASQSIGSIWYGWVPGYDYLPGVPSSAAAPTGWSAIISYNSIEFIASSPAYYITPGSSLPGFSYQAAFSPTTLAHNLAASYSYAYSGPIEGDAGEFFRVSTIVPEPSALVLLTAGSAAMFPVVRRRLRLC